MNREEVARVLSVMRYKLGCVGLLAADTNVARKSLPGAIGPDAGEMAPNGDEGAGE